MVFRRTGTTARLVGTELTVLTELTRVRFSQDRFVGEGYAPQHVGEPIPRLHFELVMNDTRPGGSPLFFERLSFLITRSSYLI